MLQRSDEWHKARLGKFTASQIYNLMGVRGLGQMGETYISDVVSEVLTGKDTELPNLYALEWGEQHEPIAKMYYEGATGRTIEEVAFIENPKYKNCGASPDGIVLTDKFGLEIKCPQNQTNHTKHLNLRNQAELKKQMPKYYWQIMFCMLMSNYNKWQFISFHPHFTEHKDLRMFVMNVNKD